MKKTICITLILGFLASGYCGSASGQVFALIGKEPPAPVSVLQDSEMDRYSSDPRGAQTGIWPKAGQSGGVFQFQFPAQARAENFGYRLILQNAQAQPGNQTVSVSVLHPENSEWSEQTAVWSSSAITDGGWYNQDGPVLTVSDAVAAENIGAVTVFEGSLGWGNAVSISLDPAAVRSGIADDGTVTFWVQSTASSAEGPVGIFSKEHSSASTYPARLEFFYVRPPDTSRSEDVIPAWDDADPTTVESAFGQPSADCYPWTYWWWHWSQIEQGDVTLQSITDDLESMARGGVSGVMLFMIGNRGTFSGQPYPYMSSAWLSLVRHAVSECRRLGIRFSIENCDGWATSGGPWITPENGMKRLIFSKTTVSGGGRIEQVLPRPSGVNDGYYQDIAVFAVPNASVVQLNDIINVTERFDTASSGFTWDAPAGEWQIVRIGCTLNGKYTHPASESGTGLECDKLDPKGIEAHFAGIEPLLQLLEEETDGAFIPTPHIDSFEAGGQNWTERLPEYYQESRGQELLPWLVTLAGVTVESAEITQRFRVDYAAFLYDRRQTAWLEHALDLLRQRGAENLVSQSHMEAADIPMGEFWGNDPAVDAIHLPSDPVVHFSDDRLRSIWVPNLIRATSAGHIYGKNVIAAETLTSRHPYLEKGPYEMKADVDFAFCQGINQITHHLWVHQPDTNAAPGYIQHGTTFNRNLTWWPYAEAWTRYVARCQYLLRQGSYVADAAFLVPQPEGFDRPRDLPSGFRYDMIYPDVFDGTESVQTGRLTLSHGTQYRLLVLPASGSLEPQLLERIAGLAEAGLTVVVQQRQADAPGVHDMAQRDAAVDFWMEHLCGDWDGNGTADRQVGSGRVFCGVTPAEAVQALGWMPDVALSGTQEWNYAHRQTDSGNFYFIVNTGSNTVDTVVELRAGGDAVELWDPSDGMIRSLNFRTLENGGTAVPVQMAPYDSFFIAVRRDRTDGLLYSDPLADGVMRAANMAPAGCAPDPVQEMAVSNGWNVEFPRSGEEPVVLTLNTGDSWTEQSDPFVKYFSGTARYSKVIDIPVSLADEAETVLDLGTAGQMAFVTVNGQNVGAVWKPPYRLSIAKEIRPGENRIELAVVNSWVNRLSRDAGLSESERVTSTTDEIYNFYSDAALEPSGLLGPVSLKFYSH